VADGDDATATNDDGAGSDDKADDQAPPTIQEALARARTTLEEKGTMMATDDGGDGDDEEEEDAEDQGESDAEEEEGGEEEAEEEGDQDAEGEEDDEAAEGDADDADDADDDVDGDEDEDEDEGKKPITVKMPGREPDSDDVEIEVDDEETAERLNQMRNGFMRGEAVRKWESELQVVQNELQGISEQFEVDPAGFVIEYVEEADLPQTALALLVTPGVWEKLEAVVDKLIGDPKELRTLQAEAKASRLETVAKLTKSREARAEQTQKGQQLKDAIDLIVPEALEGNKRAVLIQDLTRDVVEHIDRNKLQSLEVKDLPTIVAARLEANGIDPLEARTAIKDGARSRGKLSTKKGPKKKPKSGKELVKASKKRRSAAAAPGPGKKSAPAQPNKLPAGQSIKERLALVRKEGGLGKFLGR
jgi:hypothetical protein